MFFLGALNDLVFTENGKKTLNSYWFYLEIVCYYFSQAHAEISKLADEVKLLKGKEEVSYTVRMHLQVFTLPGSVVFSLLSQVTKVDCVF